MKKHISFVIGVILMIGILAGCTDQAKNSTENKNKEQASSTNNNNEKKKITVTIEAVSDTSNGEFKVKGKTNLPDGTKLIIGLKNKEGYFAASNAVVKSGKFVSGKYLNNGDPLNPGKYTIIVTMPIASEQPEEIQKIIGNKGQNLDGPLVKHDDLGTYVSKEVQVKVKGSTQPESLKNKSKTENHSSKSGSEFLADIKKMHSDLIREFQKQRSLSEEGKFAREFSNRIDTFQNQVKNSDLSGPLQMYLSVAAGDLRTIFFAYTDQNNKDIDTFTKLFKQDIQNAKKQVNNK